MSAGIGKSEAKIRERNSKERNEKRREGKVRETEGIMKRNIMVWKKRE